MTGGGPYYATLFVPLLMYETAFDRFRFGQGAAMMLLLLAGRRRADRPHLPCRRRLGLRGRGLAHVRGAAARWPRLAGFHAAALGIAAVFVVPGLWVVAASLRRPGLPPPATIEWLPDPRGVVELRAHLRDAAARALSRQLAAGRRPRRAADDPGRLVGGLRDGAAPAARALRAARARGDGAHGAADRGLAHALPRAARARADRHALGAAGAGVDGLEPVLRADLLLDLPPPARGAVRGGPARRAGSAPHLGVDRDAARPPGDGRRRRS